MVINIHEAARTRLHENEYKYLLLLEFYDDFIDEVRRIRKKLNLHFLDDEITPTNRKEHADIKQLDEDTWEMMSRLNIPSVLSPAITSFIEWGSVLSASTPINIIPLERNLADRLVQPYLLGPAIQINLKIPKKQFLKEIDRQWGEIEQIMNQFALFPEEIQKVSIRDIEENILIYRLRKQNVPHMDIMLRLDRPDRNKEIWEEAVRQRTSSMKKLLEDLGFIKKT